MAASDAELATYGSTDILTMTDDAGEQDIETVFQGSSGFEGEHALLFYTSNCAPQGGCTP